MMKRIYRPIGFHYRECDSFAEYLHKQSLKGWHFKEFRFGMVFEKGEPEERYYSVEVFPNNTEQDLRPEAETQEYAEYCQAAGWKFVDGIRKFCVFERISEAAVPIVTDEEKFDNVWPAEKKGWLFSYLFGIFFGIYSIFLFRSAFPQWAFQAQLLTIVTCFLLLFAFSLWQGLSLLCWYFREKKHRKSGAAIHFQTGFPFPYIRPLINCAIFAPMIISIIKYAIQSQELNRLLPNLFIIACLLGVNLFFSFFRPDRVKAKKIQFGSAMILIVCGIIWIIIIAASPSAHIKASTVPPDGFPLLPSDLFTVEREAEPSQYVHSESILGTKDENIVWFTKEADINADTYRLSYTVYRPSSAWIRDKLWKCTPKDMLNRPMQWEDCSEEWSGLEARRADTGIGMHYWVLYDNAVLDLYINALYENNFEIIERKLSLIN